MKNMFCQIKYCPYPVHRRRKLNYKEAARMITNHGPNVLIQFDLLHITKWKQSRKGPFINYVRVPRGGGLKISTYSYFGCGQTNSYVIFSKSIFYIIDRPVKWFSRDHNSFI